MRSNVMNCVARKEYSVDIENIPAAIRSKLAGKTGDELVKLAQTIGVELTDEQVDDIAGGALWDESQPVCPNYVKCSDCGNTIGWSDGQERPTVCPYCGHVFDFID